MAVATTRQRIAAILLEKASTVHQVSKEIGVPTETVRSAVRRMCRDNEAYVVIEGTTTLPAVFGARPAAIVSCERGSHNDVHRRFVQPQIIAGKRVRNPLEDWLFYDRSGNCTTREAA